MKPSKLYEALHALIGERVPLHIWGPCGVGKSQIVGQVAADLDFNFLDVRAVQLDPVDLRGLPRIASDQTEWVPPKFLPTTGKGILFLDELTSAPQMTQAGCYQLVLDRKLGEYVLPDGWVVIAAGNPASERGVHFAMPRPLRNRFVHLELDADLDDWCKWAVKAGIRPEIIAFLRFKPDLLHAADTTADANAWPTPRSWEMASNVLCGVAKRRNAILLSGTSEFEAQLLDGTVGEGAASELLGFLRQFRQLPSIDEILLSPATAPVPTETSAQIAVATALVPEDFEEFGCGRVTLKGTDSLRRPAFEPTGEIKSHSAGRNRMILNWENREQRSLCIPLGGNSISNKFASQSQIFFDLD
jgi:hypothetical protein